MLTLNVYDHILSGFSTIQINKQDITYKLPPKLYYDGIANLIENELGIVHKNDVNGNGDNHEIINRVFHLYCVNKEIIDVDLNFMNEYNGFKYFLISSSNDILLRYNELVKLYPNCKEIRTKIDKGIKDIILSKSYFDEFLLMLNQVNNSNLRKIIITNPKIICTDDEFLQIQKLFQNKNWSLEQPNFKADIPTFTICKNRSIFLRIGILNKYIFF